MPTKTGKKKSAWSAKDIYDMFVKNYGFTNVKSREIRKAEADKYTIPYIPEKEIMLTTGRYNTGKISTNVLDSIYNAAKRTNVPVDIALGLAGRESTLGIGRGFKRGQSVSGTDLMSNWQQIQPVVYKDSERNRWNETVRKEKSGQQLNEQDYLDRLDFLIKNQDAIESTKPLNENPIDNALKLYQSGKYNPGDKRHTQMVEEDAKVLMSDPAIQKWLKTKTETQMKCGGRRKADLGTEKKDNTNVAPTHREQVFIPASGPTLMKQKSRAKVAGRPVSSGAIEIVSPEFDLLTGIRGINSLFDNVIGRKLSSNYAYRRAGRQELDDIISTKSFRKIPDNVEIEGGRTITLPNGKTVTFKKAKGNSHKGKAFAAGEPWKGTTSSGNKSSEIIIGVPGNNAKWKVGHHGSYTEPMEFNKISKGEGLFVPFDDNGVADISIKGLKEFTPTRFKNRYISKDVEMKCGGRRKGQLGLDIREGGIAIPIANNMFYINGRKHAAGGVAIGPNNKNGVEVEGGEVVEMIDSNHPSVGRQFKAGGQQQTMRVFSSIPFLRGVSPAELVLRGANPNKVFKAQEEFKDKNRINDDGSRYEIGGEKIIHINDLPSSFRGRKIGNNYYQIGFPPTLSKAKSWNNKFSHHLNSLNVELKQFGNDILSIGRSVIPKYGKKYYDKAVQKVKRAFMSGETDDINNNAQRLGQLSALFNTDNDKKEYGGMIYTINGNVKNGLMSARPKAQYGTIKRHGKIWKWDEENGAYVPINNSEEKVVVKNNKANNKTTEIKSNKNYTINGTFDNARPQYYAEKRLPIAGSQSIAEKAGLARSGWSYGKNPTVDYVPNINISVPINYAKAVGDNSKKSTSSTPRGRATKASTPKVASQSTPTIQDTVNKITADALKASKTPKIDLSKAKMPKFDINRLESKKTKETKAKLDTSSTGGGTQSKDERLIPQFKPINTGDWIGLGSNLAGHIASYFINNNLLKKYPMPIKPVPFQAAKLKTTHNINPQLTGSRETEQMNLAEVGRNTASSNTSLARKQRIMNEARDARNKLYGQKENIETQLINVDRRNRQDVYNRNIAAYNDWLDKTYVAKTNKMLDKQRNIMHMISGIPSAVNYMLGNIETRKSTNNTMHAIAAANPNVDGRLLGIGDYYVGEKTKKKYDKFSNLIG